MIEVIRRADSTRRVILSGAKDLRPHRPLGAAETIPRQNDQTSARRFGALRSRSLLASKSPSPRSEGPGALWAAVGVRSERGKHGDSGTARRERRSRGKGFRGSGIAEGSLCILAALLLTTLVLATTPSALANPATPAPYPAAKCTAAPRSESELTALLSATNIATPAATTGGETVLEGTPAAPADAIAIESIVSEWLACQNAGEPLRAWSLFTDGYLYRLLSRQGGISVGGYALLATPSPSTSEPARLLEIREQRELPDGRLGATVTINYPSVPMPKHFFFSFTREHDRLLIDGILGEISFSVP